jgi:hypothetical protein
MVQLWVNRTAMLISSPLLAAYRAVVRSNVRSCDSNRLHLTPLQPANVCCGDVTLTLQYARLFLVTRGGVTLLAGHTHQPDESDCGGLQHCCH